MSVAPRDIARDPPAREPGARQTIALVRFEYRFGLAGKGEK